MESNLRQQGLGALEDMRKGVSYRGVVTVRGYSVALRPISMDEETQITAEVISELNTLQDTQRTAIQEARLLAKKTLVVASTSDFGANDAKLTELVLGRFTSDEIQFLYKQYCDICESVNPALESVSTEELSALVLQVKKSPSELTKLSRLVLCQMVDSLLPKDGD